MNSEIVENVQRSIRPGEMVDTFYYGDTNSELQAYPCVVNNKFVQAFTNPNGGTSQFVISPYQGVSDIVLYFQTSSTASTVASMLPQGWGYSLIQQVSVRYGSSAQYYFTGEQIYLQNLIDAEDSKKQDQLAALGGNALANAQLNAAGAAGVGAYVYLNLPHNSPRADGKPLPFPSDLLVQPIIITVQLANIASVFLNDGSGTSSGLPQTLAVASMQVKQEMMSDSADLLARRVDMNTHAYTFPLKYFPQQEVQINLANTAGLQNVNLTGFRAGEVRSILLWLTKNSDQTLNGSHSYQQITQATLTYNGEIFYRSDGASSTMWNLIQDTKAAGVNSFSQVGNPATWGTNVMEQWVKIDFAQVNVPYDKEVKLVHGKPILNAVVNLSFQTPTAAADYVLHAVYLYNSSLLVSRGSAEYVF